MTGLLYRLGHACARWRFVVLGVWLVMVVALAVAAQGARLRYDQQRDPARHREPERHRPPERPLPKPGLRHRTRWSLPADSGKLTDSKYSKAIKSSVSALKKTPHVTARREPPERRRGGRAQQGQADRLHIGGARRRPGVDHRGRGATPCSTPRTRRRRRGSRWRFGGYIGQELSKPDTGASDKIGILAAMLILLLVFGSAVAMGLPIVTAVLGLLCGLSVVTLLSHIADIPTDRTHAGDR